jgi:hypothetical protein
VKDLAGGGFIAQQRNVVLVGGTGTGRRPCHRHRQKLHPRRHPRPVLQRGHLVNRLKTESRSGRQGWLADHLTRMDFIRTRLSPLCPVRPSAPAPSRQPAL